MAYDENLKKVQVERKLNFHIFYKNEAVIKLLQLHLNFLCNCTRNKNRQLT